MSSTSIYDKEIKTLEFTSQDILSILNILNNVWACSNNEHKIICVCKYVTLNSYIYHSERNIYLQIHT